MSTHPPRHSSTRPQIPGRPRHLGAPTARQESSGAPGASQRNPSGQPASREDTAALFRAYRSIPLEQVLERVGAVLEPSGLWRLTSGQEMQVSGDPGFQSWQNKTNGAGNRGAIDLVAHLQGHSSIGRALNWLRREFPDVQVQPPSPAARSGAVRRENKGEGWSKEDLDKLFERYKSIQLTEVLDSLGAHHNQDGDPNKSKIDAVGNIIFKGQRWQNANNEAAKGYGGPSLVTHALGLPNQVEGLRWMIKEFGEEFGDDLVSDEIDEGPKDFSPPERFPDIADRVADYLITDRYLPSALVHSLIEEGNVYGSHPWYEKGQRYITNVTRCVFLGPASAELRDTTADGFKGCCDGSQTDSSGFSVRPHPGAPAENIVAMTEAAIDAISYRALFPGRFVMSTNGAGRFMLQYRIAREAVSRGLGVRMALDADMAGDVPAQKIFNAFYVRKALSHHLKVAEAQVDKWIEDGDLVIAVDRSPHHLFFNHGWEPELDVCEVRQVPTPTGSKDVWEPNGETARPSIRLQITRNLHEKLQRGSITLTVSQAGFNYVVETLNVKRERPVNTKDWNAEVERLGSQFSLEYDALAKDGFKDGVPTLPSDLQALRAPQDHPSPPAPDAPAPTRGSANPGGPGPEPTPSRAGAPRPQQAAPAVQEHPSKPPAASAVGGRPPHQPVQRARPAGMRR